MQLGVVWDPLLKADPEGPTLISRTACLHGLSVHVERLSHVRLQHTHHLRAGAPRRFHRDRLRLDPVPPPGTPCTPGNQRLTSVAVGTGVASCPPRRSRRAALSGSSAIAGFRPHRSHRAALPQWALQKGPETDRSSVPGLMDDRFGEWEGGQDLLERLPGHAALLASFAECLSPKPDDAVFESAKRPVVEDDPVVLTVSSQYLPYDICISLLSNAESIYIQFIVNTMNVVF